MFYEEENKHRIENICQILMEMADGNFSYRIPRTKEDDTLEMLTVLINWLAEEMEGTLFHFGYVNPHTTYCYTIQSTYVLSEDGIINDFSPNVPNLLGIDPSRLLGLHFSNILEKESVSVWQTAIKLLLQNNIAHTSLLLNFRTSKKLQAPATCSVFRLFKKKKIMVSLFKAAIEEKNPVQKNEQEQGIEIHKQDTRLIQSVYDYILPHKNASLPTLKELARIFGTNEFKLKAGFRYLFKTSIYQFYTDTRLEKAHMLIEHTAIPLKEIAYMSGYNTYPNFSRAFKIKFGCTPNSIGRSSPN
jgi:AraC-like DNA-binding protein